MKITPLRHTDFSPEANPSGEKLLLRSVRPYEVWVPANKTIVLGNSQLAEIELNTSAVLTDHIPVYKRMSGGGAVLLSKECLCVGLRFKKQKQLNLHDYFSMGGKLIQTVVMQELQLELHPRGISDLVFADKKISGCALYMPKDYVLYLVSILVNPQFSEFEKYLAHPSKEPDYRMSRNHSDFLTGLSYISEKTVATEKWVQLFIHEIERTLLNELD